MDLRTAEICRVLDVPARSLSQWVKDGLVLPDREIAFREPKSGGRAHVFSEVNLVEFAVLKHLREIGCSVNLIKDLLDNGRKTERRLRWFGLEEREKHWLLISCWSAWSVIRGDNLLLGDLGRFSFIMDLAEIKQELRQILAAKPLNRAA